MPPCEIYGEPQKRGIAENLSVEACEISANFKGTVSGHMVQIEFRMFARFFF